MYMYTDCRTYFTCTIAQQICRDTHVSVIQINDQLIIRKGMYLNMRVALLFLKSNLSEHVNKCPVTFMNWWLGGRDCHIWPCKGILFNKHYIILCCSCYEIICCLVLVLLKYQHVIMMCIPFRLPLAFYDEDTLMLFVAVKVGIEATAHTHTHTHMHA